MRRVAWMLAIAALGVLNQALVVGQFPWVSLSLAFSFATYGAMMLGEEHPSPLY